MHNPSFSMLSSLVAGLSALAALLLLFRPRRSRLPLPPGPKGYPLIGNLLQIPKNAVWKYFGTETLEKYGMFHHSCVPLAFRTVRVLMIDLELAQTEGDIAYFSVLGSQIIVLNSYSAAHDLLFQRSSIYSNRPRLPMAGIHSTVL